MADLTCNFVGIKSPNPFWLASAPPTDKAYNVNRAFEAGWGGVVWKTLGLDPPIVNVSSRYGAIQLNGQRIAGLGVGPALARALVRAHGGDVWLSSRADTGTTFTLSVPLDGQPGMTTT